MKSKYYYGWCYYEELPDPYRKWYKIDGENLIILRNYCEMDGAFYKLIELRAIKKKLDLKVFGKAL